MDIEVIFLRDVPGLARRGDVKEVARGYAAQVLFPRKLAEPASAEKKRRAAAAAERREKERAAVAARLREAVARLDGAEIVLRERANAEGHLFRGVRETDVVAAIREARGIEVPEDAVRLDAPLKTTGRHEVKIRAGGGEAALAVLIEGKE